MCKSTYLIIFDVKFLGQINQTNIEKSGHQSQDVANY